jgi:hypothetical protein
MGIGMAESSHPIQTSISENSISIKGNPITAVSLIISPRPTARLVGQNITLAVSPGFPRSFDYSRQGVEQERIPTAIRHFIVGHRIHLDRLLGLAA